MKPNNVAGVRRVLGLHQISGLRRAKIDVLREGLGMQLIEKRIQIVTFRWNRLDDIRPPFSRTSTARSGPSAAAVIAEAGMRTAALAPRFLTSALRAYAKFGRIRRCVYTWSAGRQTQAQGRRRRLYAERQRPGAVQTSVEQLRRRF